VVELQTNGNRQDQRSGRGQRGQDRLGDPIEPTDPHSAGSVEEPTGHRGYFVVRLANQKSDLAKAKTAVGKMTFELRPFFGTEQSL